jgi:capsular polysaccharide transport system permease protein
MNKQDETSGAAAKPGVETADPVAGTLMPSAEHTAVVPEGNSGNEATVDPVGGGRKGRKGRKGAGKGGRANRGAVAAPRPAPAAAVVQVQPIARPAHMKRHHWGLFFSFLLLVAGPLAALVFYLWTYAEDQYVSTTGFIVRSQESGGATEILGGLAQFTGGSTASDSDILYEFIQSQEMVATIDARVDLRAHYSQHWPRDWAFSIWPDASLEALGWYWQRIVGISYDSATGLTEVQAVGFTPEMAQRITSEIVRESQDRINALNNQARGDAMRYANDDLQEALDQVKAARQALIKFRTRTRIVDPAADIQARMGVMNNLQQQLAEALIEYDLLVITTTSTTDPRLTKARQRIDVIRERIVIERQTFASNSTETGAVGEDYPTLISEFESLTVDLEYAEATYRAALTAREVARDDVARQSRYLATYIKPTRPQTSEYPERYILSGLAGLFLLLVWSILALVYYSIRDRS